MVALDVLVKILAIVLALSVGYGIKYVMPSIKDDNVIEQTAEKVIKDETGVDMDFTPDSPNDAK